MKQLAGASLASLVLAAWASAQAPAGGEFRVNTYTTGRQTHAHSAMQPDGDFVVVWMSGQDGSYYGVFGQRYAPSGAPRGSEFRINTYTTGTQEVPAVAVGGDGDFVVVWVSAEDALSSSIQGQRFDAAGNPLGAEFLVNTFTPHQSFPHVGVASDGGFVVSWNSLLVDGSGYGIAARRFDRLGSPIGSEFVVNTYTTGGQTLSDIVVEPDGSFVVVWVDYSNRAGSGSAILGQRYDAPGNRLGTEFQVNSFTTRSQRWPSVSVSATGEFIVVWTSEFGDGSAFAVSARRFDAWGNALGSEFLVNTYTTGYQSGFFQQVARDALGNFIVTWEGPAQGGSTSVFAQRFSATGEHRGVEFQVNAQTTGDNFLPAVVSDAVGNFVISWTGVGQDGGDRGIFGQRFGGLVPATLVADSSGNRVLEPGETVDVRPTWRNFNGAAQAFSGTLSNITGPAGATYTITDPSGDYGTVADDTSGECADCYEVRVSNPNPRPALHWDASVVESILPDTQGQQKQFLLHVGTSFTDVATASPFYPFIETLLHKGVTGGCGGTNYCPSATTTRDQMSVFVLLAKEGPGYMPPACGTPVFNDVPASNPFCRYIEELWRRQVVSGCGSGNFCPTSPVPRSQMAIFAVRTLDPNFNPPMCGTPMFNDVPASSPFCKWIEELARRGVVSGCGGGNYCPDAAVTREQMGVFISATFGLTLYGP
jgi:hypothetical protein